MNVASEKTHVMLHCLLVNVGPGRNFYTYKKTIYKLLQVVGNHMSCDKSKTLVMISNYIGRLGRSGSFLGPGVEGKV